MRVIHVIDSLNVGGAERVMITLCNILKAQGVDVSVCVLTGKYDLLPYLDKRVPVYKLSRSFRWSLSKLYKVNKICADFDIVHVHLRYNLRYIGLAKLLFNGRYPVLLHDHFGDIDSDRGVPFGLAFFMKRAWVAGVHPKLVQWAVEDVKIRKDRAIVLPNTIVKDQTAIKPDFTTIKTQTTFSILNVANFRVSKNQLFAIQLFEQLTNYIPVNLTLVGGVNDPDYFGRVYQLATDMRLAKRITFQHSVSNIQPILHQYTLAIHTASLESGPLVLLEYLALGLPFLAYKTGQVAEELQSVFPEFFIETFEIQDWIDQIKVILNMDLQILQDRMIWHFERHYTPESFGKKCLDFYADILKT